MKKLFLYLGLMGAAYAQSEGTNFFERKNDDCFSGMTTRVGVKHREYGGVGYNTGYTTLELFLAPKSLNRVQPFLDARGHILNDGKFASNVGVGLRVAPLEKFAIGLNSYWDYRQVKHLPSNQVGGGLELLSPWFDFRLNGYFPFGDKTYVKRATFQRFSGNQILVKQKSKAELTTLYGEVGVPIPGPFRLIDMYLAAGPYYIFTRTVGLQGKNEGKTPAAWGGKFRASARVYDGIEIGMNVTYDHIFKWNVQGVVSLSFPFGPGNMRTKGKRWKERYDRRCQDGAKYVARMTQPVQRNEIIPILEKSFGYALSANCLFVNNALGVNGNGTFEFPFNNLTAAQNSSGPFDCIYVFQGGGTYNTPAPGFLLQRGQFFTSASLPLVVDGVTIPPQSNSNPILTNPLAAPVFLLGEGVTIQGVTIQGSPLTTNAFLASGTGTFTIDRNVVQGLQEGAFLGTGPLAVGTKTFTNNIFQNNMLSGAVDIEVQFQDVLGGVITIDNNTFTIPTATDAFIDIKYPGSATNELAVVFTRNALTNTAGGFGIAGLFATSSGGSLSNLQTTFVIADNTFDSVGVSGVFLQDVSSRVNFQFLRNTYAGSGADDIQVIQGGVFGETDSQWEGVVQNNRSDIGLSFDNSGGVGTTHRTCLDISGNVAPTYRLTNSTGDASNFRVKSSDGTAAGVTSRNTGTFTFIGPFTFTPLDSECYP